MDKDNKNEELNNTDKKLHISDVMCRFICMIPILGPYFLIPTNNLEWYDKNKMLYISYSIINVIVLSILAIIYT